MSTRQAVLGSVRFARGNATTASNCVTWDSEQDRYVMAKAVECFAPEVAGQAKQNSAFAAVRHENRMTNQAVIVRESDVVFNTRVKDSNNERFHTHRGRLLTFKKSGR